MKKITRTKPKAEEELWRIKNFAFNDVGKFFIVYTNYDDTKEQIFTIHQDEFERMRKFIARID